MLVEDLNIVLAVSRERSVRKAARSIHVSQSAISKKIHDLEQSLGIELFVRTSYGMILTEQGQLFLSYASHALDILKEGIHAAKLDRRYSIKIGVTSPLINLVSRVANYYQSQNVPNRYNLEVMTLNSLTIVEWLQENILDYGIFSFPHVPPHIESYPLYMQDFYLIGPSIYTQELIRYAGRSNVFVKLPFIRWMQEVPLVLPKKGFGLRVMVEQMFEREILTKPNIVAETDTQEVIDHLVKEGYGCTISSKVVYDISVKETELSHQEQDQFTIEELPDSLYHIPINFLFPRRKVYFAHNRHIKNFPDGLISMMLDNVRIR